MKCPGFKREGDSETPEPFAEEAKQFVEARLLHRDVQVILEGVANQSSGILLGTVQHPVSFRELDFLDFFISILYDFFKNGNISEFLLREGLAKCVDWSMGVVTAGPEKYRASEKY